MEPLSCFTLDHFVDQVVGKEFECPVCYGIMFQIREVTACGHLFCDSCITKLEECPLCKGKDLDHHESKYLERRLGDQRVRCYIENCTRTFTINEARDHLAKEHGIGVMKPVPVSVSDPDYDYDEIVHQYYPEVSARLDDQSVVSELSLDVDYETSPVEQNQEPEHDQVDPDDPFIVFKITISGSDVESFGNIFMGLKHITDTVTLNFTQNKIAFQVLTDDRCMMAVGKFERPNLSEYIYRGGDEGIKMMIQLHDLARCLVSSSHWNRLNLVYRSNAPEWLEVRIGSIGGAFHHRLAVDRDRGLGVVVPSKTFDSITTLDVRYLRFDPGLVPEYVDFEASRSWLRINNTTLRLSEPLHKMRAGASPVTLRFDTRLVTRMREFANRVKKTVVQLYLRHDFPMAIKYDLSLGPVYIFASPIMINDEAIGDE